MTLNRRTLSRALAQHSKRTSTPLTVAQSETIIQLVVEILTDELAREEGRVEIENFLVLHNRAYVQANLTTRTLQVNVSPQLKQRMKQHSKR
jgi:nucleoid DNA-binding protein